MNVKDLVREYKDYIIKMRREFHMYPESSWEEVRTSRRIKEELDTMGIPYLSLAETGILASIEGKGEGKTVALRADMDALEITESNDLPYKSQHAGKMHACGHDGHMAMLLGAAKVLNRLRDSFNGKIFLIFQPAEEIAGGAKKMIEENNFMDEVDGVFAIHLWANIEVGKVSVNPGPRMASADFFSLKIKGKSGHGSMPEQTIDALVAGSALVMNLQSMVSREISPLEPVVLSIGSFHSGTRYNIIANEAILQGTTRAFNPELRKQFPDIIERIAKNTAASYRAEASLDYTWGTPPTINDKDSSLLAKKSVEKLFGESSRINFERLTVGEDFAYFLEKAPGLLALVGVRNENKGAHYPHHHNRFNMDEDGLEIGCSLYVQYALDFLNS